jgi:hypothetical protein
MGATALLFASTPLGVPSGAAYRDTGSANTMPPERTSQLMRAVRSGLELRMIRTPLGDQRDH